MGVIWEKYDAIVTSNDDDEKRGRIKVACVGLMGDEDTELPMWIEPIFDWGWFYVPDIGEIVEIEVVVSSDEDEINGQMGIDNLSARWRNKRYNTIDEPEDDNTTPTPIHPNFLDNYGKRRGFSTPHGHTFIFDDTSNSPIIQLTLQKTKLEVGETPEAADISRLEFESDGSFKLTLLENTTLHLQTAGKKLSIGIDGGVGLVISEKDSDAVATIGDGAVSGVIAENLKTYIDNAVKLHADSHIHPTAMGDSGTAKTQMDAYDDAITSSHLKFPDG